MKKIVALGLLSSLVGCAQLMPPTTPLQTPIDTINTTAVTDAFVEPTIVAELEPSIKTDPLYQSSDSIAVSEQVIKTQPAPTTAIAETTVANDAVIAAPVAVEPTTEAAVSNVEAATTEPLVPEAATVANDAVIAAPVTAQPTTEAVVTNVEAATTEPLAPEAVAVANDAVIAAPVAEAAATESAITENTAAEEPNMATSETATPEVPVVESTIEEPAIEEPAIEVPTANPALEETSQATDDGYKVAKMHGYSVQVTASRNEPSLVTLVSLLDSQQPAWINKKMLNGSLVYTLLLGHYADYDQAKAALTSLPQALQQNGAFVRNFYDIEHTGSPLLKSLQ